MPIIGSRYGKTNQYADGKGKGFTVICNDCGVTLDNKDVNASFCVVCESIATITCPSCNQQVFMHDTTICIREVNYVQGDERPVAHMHHQE